jgi:hypothetical protein
MPTRSINWASVRSDYINGDAACTFTTLAVRYHVRADTIRRHAAPEDWTAERAARAAGVVQQQRNNPSSMQQRNWHAGTVPT